MKLKSKMLIVNYSIYLKSIHKKKINEKKRIIEYFLCCLHNYIFMILVILIIRIRMVHYLILYIFIMKTQIDNII